MANFIHSLHHNLSLIKEILGKEEITCNNVINFPNYTAQCAFVQENPDICTYDGVVMSYTELTYCDLNNIVPLACLVLFLFLMLFFLMIGIVADDFLCPALLTISKTLRLPDNIAGVTFLAFGNGAPDIFSSIGGISHAKPSLIFSSLFGAGIFVTTVVTGSVLLTGDFSVMKRPMMRDIVMYIGASFLVWLFIYNQVITLYHSIGLVCYYLLYIILIIASRYIYLRTRKDASEDINGDEAVTTSGELDSGDNKSVRSYSHDQISTHGSRRPSMISTISFRLQPEALRNRSTSYDDDIQLTRFFLRRSMRKPRRARANTEIRHMAHHHLENTLNQITRAYEADRKNGVVEDVRYKDTIEIDDHKPRTKSTAYTNEIKFTNNFGKPKYFSQWSNLSKGSSERWLAMIGESKDFMIHITPVDILEWNSYNLFKKLIEVIKAIPYFILTITIPVVDLELPKDNWCRPLICLNILLAPQVAIFLLTVDIDIGPLPLWSVALMVSILLIILVIFTSNSAEPPIYHRVFGFFGFVISVVFINGIVTEVIRILETIGIIFGLSDSILGLTVLALGNSLGDIISNISMARHGYPGMAIAACFGGPMLNLLMGLGVPYTVMFVQKDESSIDVKYTKMITLLYTTLTISLTVSFFIFIIKRFKSWKIHGMILISIYLTYVTLALLIEFRVI